jgi:hypothetical protein
MIVPSVSSQISRLVCISIDRPTLKNIDRSKGARIRQILDASTLSSSYSRTFVKSERPETDKYSDLHHSVQIEKSLRRESPQNGNIAGNSRRLSANSRISSALAETK